MCNPIRFERVMTVHGDAVATQYLKSGFVLISSHLYEQVVERNNNGQPKRVNVLSVYILGVPVSEAGNSLDFLSPNEAVVDSSSIPVIDVPQGKIIRKHVVPDEVMTSQKSEERKKVLV